MKRATWRMLLVCLSSTATSAGSERYRIEWHATRSCPSVTRLYEEISRRTDQLEVANDGAQLAVDVRQDGSGYYVGRVTLPGERSREVKATSCTDVVPALAFIIVTDLEQRMQMPEPASERPSRPEPDVPAAGSQDSWHAYLGATGELSGARTPQWMPLGGLSIELWKEGTLVGRGAQASVVFGTDRLRAAPGALSASYAGMVLELCPVGISIVSVCGGFDTGLLHTRASDALSRDTTLRFSLVGRAGMKLRWTAGAWVAEVRGGVLLPLTLDEWVVRGADGRSRVIHEAGLSGFAGLFLGYRL